jgi:hypothetical protein
MANPLLSDRNVDFLLYEVLEVDRRLGALPAFAEHGRETYDLYLAASSTGACACIRGSARSTRSWSRSA